LIRDLDELTTEDELKRALEAQAEITAAVVAIKSLRQTQYGGKTAVIAVPANLADPFIKRGKLRVGWSQFQIKELEPRQRCFRRAGLGSVVDLTNNSGSSFRLTRWRLSEDYTGSEHLAIICDLVCHPSSQAQISAKARLKYKTDTLDTQVFREQFLPTASRQGAKLTAAVLMRQLKAACDASMQTIRTHSRQRAPVYWWNQETARRDCLSARRCYQRARGAESFA